MGAILKYGLLLAVIVGLAACDSDLPGFIATTSDNVEKRTEQSLALNGINGYKTIVCAQEEYQLCLVSDTHFGTGRNFEKVETAVRNSALALVLVGDVSTGKKADCEAAAELFSALPSEIITLVGNHDLYFDGWQCYKAHFGSSVYYFEVQTPTARDLHICLDSGNGTLGVKQYKWLKNLLASSRGNYRYCFVYSHTNLFRTDNSQGFTGNMPLEETYQLMDLFSKNRVNAVFMGHDHEREELFFNKVQYLTLHALQDGTKNASYVLLTVNAEIKTHTVALP